MTTSQYLTLTEAAAATPGRPHVSAVWRWARKGVKVRGSQSRIKLNCVRAGSRLLTTAEWLDSFMKELAKADESHFETVADVPIPPPASRGQRTEGQRQAAAEAARRRIKGAVA